VDAAGGATKFVERSGFCTSTCSTSVGPGARTS